MTTPKKRGKCRGIAREKDFPMNITSCSVRILRSFDYCHFEVNLGAQSDHPISGMEVDELRKQAARLADKGVEQYKRRKAALERIADYDTRRLRGIVEEVEKKKECDRTPEEKAAVKELGDIIHEASLAQDYGWDDEW